MNKDMIRLFKWFDKKTNQCHWSAVFAECLAGEDCVPNCMRGALKQFKKCNKVRRVKLASDYINIVINQ